MCYEQEEQQQVDMSKQQNKCMVLVRLKEPIRWSAVVMIVLEAKRGFFVIL